jgi:hypothetical protein
VATQVIDALKLYANPRFAGPTTTSAEVREFAALPPSLQRQLINRFGGDLTVGVVPNTQVVASRCK